MIRNHFFDTNTKFQVNVPKTDEIDLLIKKNHGAIETQKIVFKTAKWFVSDEETARVSDSGLL